MDSLLRLPAVMGATGLARPTIYLRIKTGLFPRPVKLSERAIAWPESEIASLNGARISGKSDGEIRALVMALEAKRQASPV